MSTFLQNHSMYLLLRSVAALLSVAYGCTIAGEDVWPQTISRDEFTTWHKVPFKELCSLGAGVRPFASFMISRKLELPSADYTLKSEGIKALPSVDFDKERVLLVWGDVSVSLSSVEAVWFDKPSRRMVIIVRRSSEYYDADVPAAGNGIAIVVEKEYEPLTIAALEKDNPRTAERIPIIVEDLIKGGDFYQKAERQRAACEVYKAPRKGEPLVPIKAPQETKP